MINRVDRALEDLMRGEIAAAETYQQVLEGFNTPPPGPLRTIQNDHGDAIRFLYDTLAAREAEVPAKSGAWGAVARTAQGAANILGDKAALRTLREGERKGVAMYRETLMLEDLPKAVRNHMEQVLLPGQERHVDVLSRLIEKG